MKSIKKDEAIMLTSKDYDLILANIRQAYGPVTFNQKDAAELEAELKKAKVVPMENIPVDVVRLDSKVTVRDETSAKLLDLTVVIPSKADIKEKKISVMSPIGTALLGYRKGQQISWRVPSGNKMFTIMDVSHPGA